MFKKRKDISIQRDQGVYLAQDAQKDAEIVRRELNVPLTGFTTRGTQTEIYRIKELTELYGRQNLCAKVFIQTKTMWGLDQVEGNCPIDEAVKINNLLALDGYCPRIYDVVKISGRTALITDFLAGDHQAKEFSDDRFEFVEQQKDHPLNWINGKFVDLQGAKFRQFDKYYAQTIDEARGFADWPVGSKQLYQTIPGLAGQRNTEERLQKWGIKRFEGDTLLDVGCNLGMFCRRACADGVKRVFGIDTPEVVNVAQKLAILDGFYNIDFIGLDLKNTHFSQIARMTGFNYFDTILFLAMSAHVGMLPWLKNAKTLFYEGHGSDRPFKVYRAPIHF